MKPELQQKYDALKSVFAQMDGAVVAFSGGVDSTLLVAIGHEVLGDNLLAVTALSETYPRYEREYALDVAQKLAIRHETIQTTELTDAEFIQNPPHRCYLCKQYLFRELWKKAEAEGYSYVVEGSNVDDIQDYRPGIKAAHDLGVSSPLITAGFTKSDIRELARLKDLPGWDKPAAACLSSRIPYGHTITVNRLKRIERTESILRDFQFSVFRVRDFGETAVIETSAEEISRLLCPEIRSAVISGFKKAGYSRITIDLQGYRTGSLNQDVAYDDQAPH